MAQTSQIRIDVPRAGIDQASTADVRANFATIRGEVQRLLNAEATPGGTGPPGPQGPQGPTGATGSQGPQGQAATIMLASPPAITGAAGSQASVANQGTNTNAVFQFTIPKGDPGDPGDITALVNTSVNNAITALMTTLDTRYVRRAGS